MATFLTAITWHPIRYLIQSILNFWKRWFQKSPKLSTDLVNFKKLSFEELFEEKLANKEYEEALSIAIKNKLNTDLVYQKQWESTPISLETIDTVLRKIKDTRWIISNCIQKVPCNFESCQALLEYGLLIIKEELENLENEKNENLEFKSYSNENKQIEENEAKKSKLAILNLEQKQLLIWKFFLIRYLKRLKTYKIILSTNDKSYQNFDESFFKQFRSQSSLEACINFARNAKWKSVEVMFNCHPQETLDHWLPILSNFPETLSPYYYQNLLPVCLSDNSNQIKKWQMEKLEELDEELNLDNETIEKLAQSDKRFEEDFYFHNPNLIEFKNNNLNNTLVSKWFQVRAREIDKFSSYVSNAIELLDIGQEHNVSDLNKLKDDFNSYSTLIYDCLRNYNNELDFDDFEKMNIQCKINLFMSGATKSGNEFAKHLQNYLVPFLKKSTKSASEEQQLLWDYLESFSEHHLDIVQNIFINYHTANEFGVIPENDLIQNDENLIRLTLKCIYANKETKHLNESFNIVECLPKNTANIFTEHPELNQKVNCLYKQLEVVELLEQYNCFFTVQEVDKFQIEKDEDSIKKIINKILRKFSKKLNLDPSFIKENDWLQLFNDLQNIRELCFEHFFKIEDLYVLFVSTLLGSGRSQTFGLATSFMQLVEEPNLKKRKKLIPFNLSIDLIIEATKNYINSANSIYDDSVKLAKECLNLIDPQQKKVNSIIKQEINFIEALSILSSEFSLKILPIQLRLMEDPKLDIIFQAMSFKTKSYKKVDQLLKLAYLLNIYSNEKQNEREAKLISFIGSFAFEKKDYKQCWSVCKRIISKNYSSAWKLCHKLGNCELFQNKPARLELLSFALTHCNVDDICYILSNIKTLKVQLLQESFSSSSSKDSLSSSFLTSIPPIDLTSHLIKLSKLKENEIEESDKKYKKTKEVTSLNIPFFYSDAFKANNYFSISLNNLDYDYFKLDSSLNNDYNDNYQALFKYQLMLRISLLNEKIDPSTILENLKQLAFYSFSTDTQLAISCLLAISQNQNSDNEFVFNRFSNKSSILIFMALYYYSILMCKNNGIELDLKKMTVEEVISKADYLTKSCPLSQNKNLVEKYFNLYCNILQSETLNSLDPNVDLDRFKLDSDYQRDTILGLALTSDDKIFNILTNLAHQYSIGLWDLYLTHFEYLITNPEIDVELIAAKIFKDSKFIDVLKKKKEEVQSYFETRIYPLLNGLDHNRLVLCHQIIEKACFSVFDNEDEKLNE